MSTHNLCFRVKVKKNMYTPVNPNFTISKWGVRGYTLHGHVSMMSSLSPFKVNRWTMNAIKLYVVGINNNCLADSNI